MSIQQIDFDSKLTRLLTEYNKDVRVVVEKVAKDAAKQCRDDIKNHPKTKSHGSKYASGWAYKKVGRGYVIYHAKTPQLTHLLNNDHAICNQYGATGNTYHGDNHIGEASRKSLLSYMKKVREEIERI